MLVLVLVLGAAEEGGVLVLVLFLDHFRNTCNSWWGELVRRNLWVLISPKWEGAKRLGKQF